MYGDMKVVRIRGDRRAVRVRIDLKGMIIRGSVRVVIVRGKLDIRMIVEMNGNAAVVVSVDVGVNFIG